MADHEDFVEVRDLIELAREVRLLVLRLDGIKGESGVLSRIESASKSLDSIDANLLTAIEKVGDVAKFGGQIKALPEFLLSQVDSMAFRASLSRILEEEVENAIENKQQSCIDKLDDELAKRMDRLAEDLFTRKIAPPMHATNALARAKSDCETYKARAESAEKLLGEIEVISKNTETDLIAQIERIRLSATQHNYLALFIMFALGWGSALMPSPL